MIDSTAVVPSCDFDAILAERDAFVRTAERIAAVIAEAPNGFPRIYVDGRRGSREEFTMERSRRDADCAGWHRLMRESGLWSFLDHQAREEWRKQLDETGDFPALTLEAAEAATKALHADRPMMVARGVFEVFRQLDSTYKSNGPCRFAKRSVIRSIVETWGSGRKYASAGHRTCDKLDDLHRVLCLLRGIPEPDHRIGAYRIVGDAIKTGQSTPWVAEFPFFEVKCYQNGNGHLSFKFAEDIDRLNRVLAYHAKGAIPDDRRGRWA